MTKPAVTVALLLAVAAFAEEPTEPEGFTHNYTHGVSLSVMAQGEVDLFFSRYSGLAVTGGAGAQLRLALGGFLVGAGFMQFPPLVTPLSGPTPEVRLSLGYAVALSRRVALSPMVRGGLWLSADNGRLQALTAGVELPVTVYLARRLFLEPYAFGGAVVSWGVAPYVALGLRAGWTF